MLKIISVNFPLSAAGILNTTIAGAETWLDADVVVIDTSSIQTVWATSVFKSSSGDSIVNDESIKRTLADLFAKRSREVGDLVKAGKMVIGLATPVRTVHLVNLAVLTNYSWMPSFMENYVKSSLISGNEKSIFLSNSSSAMAPYFHILKGEIGYSAYFNEEQWEWEFFLTNRLGKGVGAMRRDGRGALYLVPRPDNPIDRGRVAAAIIQSALRFYGNDIVTPAPEWSSAFIVPGIEEAELQISALQKEIDKIENFRNDAQVKLAVLYDFRKLLYEQGKPLETVVLRSLQLMGFVAEPYKDSALEHDVLFESEEGRGIAEVEGKDSDAIHVDKLDQLSRVVDEDFDRQGEYARGVLIGNPYRLLKPEERGVPFTEKAVKTARQKRFGLLTTAELFRASTYILEHRNNELFKKDCRIKILNAEGEEVQFQIPEG